MKKIMLKLRELAKLFPSQEDFARKIGISQPMVSRWFAGTSLPSKRTLLRIAGVFGLPPEMLTEDSIPLDTAKIYQPAESTGTISVEELIDHLKEWSPDTEIIFSGALTFYRIKKRGPSLAQIEFNQSIWRNELGDLIVDSDEDDSIEYLQVRQAKGQHLSPDALARLKNWELRQKGRKGVITPSIAMPSAGEAFQKIAPRKKSLKK